MNLALLNLAVEKGLPNEADEISVCGAYCDRDRKRGAYGPRGYNSEAGNCRILRALAINGVGRLQRQ